MDDQKYTLEQIRRAQTEIAFELANKGLESNRMLILENASLHLRNLERLMVSKIEMNLIVDLKVEARELKGVIKELSDTSARLFKLTGILKEIVKITGKVIDILSLLK